MGARWDIFCSVIDNYGDAGVCWRLARQLSADYGMDVCLWIDRLEILARLVPTVDATQAGQGQEGVQVRRWQPGQLPRADADVVIEAFACELGEAAIASLAARSRPPLWINLEYLGTEDWVDSTHGLWSVHPATGLRKLFFIPGFSAASGGLLRARGLREQQDDFLRTERAAFLATLGVPEARHHQRLMSLFAYPHAPVAGLLQSLVEGAVPWTCLLADGTGQDAVLPVCGRVPATGEPVTAGNLTVVVLPCLSQAGYDRLLWACDINAVRGEDSFVQAQWAAHPLLWQAYPQAGAAHEAKLAAFLARYTDGWPVPLAQAVRALHEGWNRGHWPADAWQAALGHWPEWRQQARYWRDWQAGLPDLASKLVQFYTDWL